MIYFVVLVTLLLFAIKYDLKPISNKTNKYFCFLFIIFVLIAGLRYRVGTDTMNYHDEYLNSSLSYIKDRYLIGWYLLMYSFSSFNCSFYIVQLVIAFVINYGVFVFLKQEQNKMLFSTLTIYYVLIYPAWNFEVLRQGICISIFFLSFSFLKRHQYIKYYIFTILACTIHETALLLLVLPVFSHFKITRANLSIFAVFSFVLIFIAPFLRDYILNITMALQFADEKAMYYLDDIDVDVSSASIASYSFNIVLNVIFPYWVLYKNIVRKRRSDLFNICAVIAITSYILSIFIPILYRINYYFVMFTYILYIDGIQYMVVLFKKKFNYCMYLLILLCFLSFKSRMYFLKDEMNSPVYVHYYPYSSLFDEHKVPEREKLK